MPTLEHLPAAAAPERTLEILKRDGALILRDVAGPEALAALRAELMPYVDATRPGRDPFSGFATTRTGALVARSPAIRDLVTHKAVLALCDGLLLPSCERYQLHLTQAIRIMPGQPAQAIHRDRWAWGRHLAGLEPQLNTIWALTDFTRENGATCVIPGSVTWDDNRKATPAEMTYAEMPAGSVLVYTGGVFHGGGSNTSDADRIGLNITYGLGWLRQEENQYLSCPPEIARTLDSALQDLMGYALGSFAMGYYSPPGAPGEGPELVPPVYALGRRAEGSQMGTLDQLAAAARA